MKRLLRSLSLKSLVVVGLVLGVLGLASPAGAAVAESRTAARVPASSSGESRAPRYVGDFPGESGAPRHGEEVAARVPASSSGESGAPRYVGDVPGERGAPRYVESSPGERGPIARRELPQSRAQLLAEHTASLRASAEAAVDAGRRSGHRTGVSIYDRTLGVHVSAGDTGTYYATESVVKVFLATHLLVSGRMAGVEAQASAMIRRSDDPAASQLYYRAGGDGVVPWAGRRYAVPNLGAGPLRPGWWGSTRVTPSGMALVLANVHSEPRVATWLMREMAATRVRGSDGANQWFGLKALDPAAAVKQGWGNDTPSGAIATPSVGYVNGGRFAVAIFSERRGTTLSGSMSVVSTQAGAMRYLMAPTL